MNGTAAWADRVIIALDLDAFYVAASRKRDPTLIGLPVGIKQKALFATTSYEARAYGVTKLMSIVEGMAKCPDLIIVNGEDLSYFRKVSMQVFKLVSSMIWGGKVEKLGMDELFCDCTEMIDAQMLEWEQNQQSSSFPVPIGYVLPAEMEHAMQTVRLERLDRQARKLFLGTLLAQQIRTRVAEEVGLTSSAGVASSKLMAKLVGNTHKPNQQTVFASISPDRTILDNQLFLDPYPLRSLNGFGSMIVEKLCTVAAKSVGFDEKDFPSSQLTVSLARQIFDRQSLRDLFGERLGARLLNLLHGKDDELVNKAPEYPNQISIEDTYRQLHGEAILEQMHILSGSLIRRLETELLETDEPALNQSFNCIEKPALEHEDGNAHIKVRDYSEEPSTPSKVVRQMWKRYPLTMRLSIRQGWVPRVSRQGKMPVEIFDLELSRPARARILAQNVIAIYRAILASDGDKGVGLKLINIAALDLSPHRPSKAIGNFFKGNSTPVPTSPVKVDSNSIDMSFFQELPRDVRREIAQQYGLAWEEEENALDDDPCTEDSLRCSQCGQMQSIWLQHDHDRFPLTGLPVMHIGDDLIDFDSDMLVEDDSDS